MPSPWLIQWGAEIFLGLLASSTLLGALSWFPLRRRRARRALRRHPALRARPVEPRRFEDGSQVTLRGTLALGGAPCRRFEDGAAVAAASIEVPLLPRQSARGPKLTLDVDGVGVELAGAIDLVLGSAERWKRWPLGKLPRPIAERAVVAGLEVGAFPHRRATLRSIAAGDAVLVAGRLEACAADRETGEYRTAARRFVLVGDEPGRPVAIAYAGASQLSGCWVSVVHCAVAGALLLCGAAGLVGEVTWYAEDPAWIAVAAATPFRRGDALEHLARRVRDMRLASPAAIREALMLAALPRYCDTAANALLWAGEPRRAARLGERCGTDLGWSVAARAWAALGALERASVAADHDEWVLGPRAIVRMHLLAGAFGRAASTAARFRRGLPECLPDALAARAGDPDALGRLASANRPEASATDTCALLYADLLAGPDRLSFLEPRYPAHARGGRRHPALTERIAALLRREADPAREDPSFLAEYDEGDHVWQALGLQPGDRVLLEANPERLPLEMETQLHGAPGLDHSVLERVTALPDPGARILAQRARLSAQRSVLESVAGHDAEARAFAADAERDLAAVVRQYPAARIDALAAHDEARGLRAAVELRAGSVRRGREMLERVRPSAWFVPLLRQIAARPPALSFDCSGPSAPTRHCQTLAQNTGPRQLWWWAVMGTTLAANEQLVTSADLSRLAKRSTSPAPSLARWLDRRTAVLRDALLDRSRAVPLAVLDEPDLEALEEPPPYLGARARELARGAPMEQRWGWLSHGDTRSLSVTLFDGRCTTFVVEADAMGVQPTLRVDGPFQVPPATAVHRPPTRFPAGWNGEVTVCPTGTGPFRVDVSAGPGSGTFVLSWFKLAPPR